jgi:hypothetical protein
MKRVKVLVNFVVKRVTFRENFVMRKTYFWEIFVRMRVSFWDCYEGPRYAYSSAEGLTMHISVLCGLPSYSYLCSPGGLAMHNFVLEFA